MNPATLASRHLRVVAGVLSANGFWHMGEFSGVYRATFGESPSETLARSKHATRDGRPLLAKL